MMTSSYGDLSIHGGLLGRCSSPSPASPAVDTHEELSLFSLLTFICTAALHTLTPGNRNSELQVSFLFPGSCCAQHCNIHTLLTEDEMDGPCLQHQSGGSSSGKKVRPLHHLFQTCPSSLSHGLPVLPYLSIAWER